MHWTHYCARLLKVLIKLFGLFDCLFEVDLGQAGIVSVTFGIEDIRID